jgi:hypothetical protein
MPAKPQWLLRVPEIIEALEAVETPVVDRASIEKMFGVSRRRAVQLLHRFGGYQTGKAFLVDRRDLIVQLKAIQDSESFSKERKRRERVLQELEEAWRLQKARAIKIPVSRNTFKDIEGLPEGIHLQDGKIVVEFADAEDLLRKMYELSQAAARDFYAFEKALSGSDPGSQEPQGMT